MLRVPGRELSPRLPVRIYCRGTSPPAGGKDLPARGSRSFLSVKPQFPAKYEV